MCIDRRQSSQLGPYHIGDLIWQLMQRTHHGGNWDNNFMSKLEHIAAICVYVLSLKTSIDWLDVLTARQFRKVILCQLQGEWNRLRRLRWYNAYYLTLSNDNVTQFTVNHSSYTNATTYYLFIYYEYHT